MSIFVQKHNPLTGMEDWVVQDEDYDHHQEIARSSFADMLHDTERNRLYERALKAAIDAMHAAGRKADVLDIGTGTGLLSMMAARHGADTVTACEAFRPMGECALKVIKRNGFEAQITVIPKRSTDITVGPDGDMRKRCNILVTEVFDTELIGEGALATFRHAHEQLLEKECIVVPHSAVVYAQVVECPLVQNWNKVKDVYDDDGKLLLKVPEEVRNCTGSAAVHDLQLSQFQLDLFKTITQPIPVFNFDWSGKNPLLFDDVAVTKIKAKRTGLAQAVFVWWKLQMDPEGEIILSCAPYWAHPYLGQERDLPWRDHWMQAIYYLPQELWTVASQELQLISGHDEFSLWFGLQTSSGSIEQYNTKPVCTCGIHAAFSRTRIGQMNNASVNKKYIKILEENISPNNSVVLILSDGFYLGLAASKLGAKKVYCVDANFLSRRILMDFIRANRIENVEVFENIESIRTETGISDIDLVFGEPYFLNSILPWDNLLFSYLLQGMKPLLSKDVKVFPQSATIMCVAVKFNDLHKIRIPLGTCEGFAMDDFDELIENSSSISDDDVEAQPLWEYPGVAVSDVEEIVTVDLVDLSEKVFEKKGTLQISDDKKGCNGVALWIDWKHDRNSKQTISTGPVLETKIGQYIQWNLHCKQGVCLFSEKNSTSINYEFKFDFNEGNITFICS